VKVAVIDTGVAIDDPDLAANIWTNPGEIAGNGIDDDHNGYVDDVHGWNFYDGNNNVTDLNGHGTHVSGTIGAVGNNDTAGPGTTDIVGVNWHVSIIPERVLGPNGTGLVSDEVSAINYAAQNGAQVVNMSLSHAGSFSQAEHDAIAAATNTLFVVAAGNDGVDVDTSPAYPCSLNLPNMICVGATDSNGSGASFSNFGNEVPLTAPGVNVLSLYPFHLALNEGFEQPLSSLWAFGGTPNTWGRTSTNAASGLWSLTDSPGGNYTANDDNWARVGALNLSAYTTCRLSFDWLSAAQVGDNLRVETATSTAGPWTQVTSVAGAGAVVADSSDVAIPISASTYVRFHFTSDATNNADGDYVDNVAVRCLGTYDSTNYAFLSGTSMATPHVAGSAALLLARFPTLTVAQLRYRLLNLSDGFAPASLNVFKAVSYGAPTASAGSNQTVKPGAKVSLLGSGTDPGRGNETFHWVQTLGTPVSLQTPDSIVATFTAPSSPTTLKFTVTCMTPEGPNAVSTAVTITVKNPK
jgi:subtilisin family serine protease